jgi:2-C-methyl-D-erythritol 4-phosphate cytidylyltransferase/2-C-methyl-D-erythritol 2,4-cyclodiphosphate synthase
MKIAAVIPAGGAGTRLGGPEPKQFLPLAGTPILIRTIAGLTALEAVRQVVVALPAGHLARARALVGQYRWPVPILCVRGGAERQDSVSRAVRRARSDADLILVHDAVRPLCDRATIERVVAAAWRTGGAVPGLPATETIQRVSRRGLILKTPPRRELFAIQTPQGFRAPILREALERAARAGFTGTDESSVVRWAGHPVAVVDGSPANLKITRPIDLDQAEILAGGRARPVRTRVGQGLDYHRLVPGRRLVLGGVEIPFEKGLEGHSDADALLHAICDALLGAAGLGDIGAHFSDRDPAHRNRPSLEFLVEVRGMLERAGWRVTNVDATILAERPRLAPYRERMRAAIAGALGLPAEAVNVKATTTEGMNAEGRGEGISAQAVALVESAEPRTPA